MFNKSEDGIQGNKTFYFWKIAFPLRLRIVWFLRKKKIEGICTLQVGRKLLSFLHCLDFILTLSEILDYPHLS